MTNTISEVSSNCWKLHWCVWDEWLKEHEHFSFFFPYFFLFFFFLSSPNPAWGGKHPGCIYTFMEWMEDCGLVRVQHFSLTGFIASLQRWSKAELSSVTMPLARLLTFCIHTESKNQTEFSLRWTLLGRNALGFCTAEPCNESQGWY